MDLLLSQATRNISCGRILFFCSAEISAAERAEVSKLFYGNQRMSEPGPCNWNVSCPVELRPSCPIWKGRILPKWHGIIRIAKRSRPSMVCGKISPTSVQLLGLCTEQLSAGQNVSSASAMISMTASSSAMLPKNCTRRSFVAFPSHTWSVCQRLDSSTSSPAKMQS